MKVEMREISYGEFKSLLEAGETGIFSRSIPDESSLHPQALLAGSYVDDELVGVCCCQREDRPDENHLGVFRILALYVDPEFRGRGIARLLLLRAAAYTKRFKGRYMWCKADPSMTIFFRKCGFYVELPLTPPADGLGIFIRETASF